MAKVIVIEGPDGVGKSRIIEELSIYFNNSTSISVTHSGPLTSLFGLHIRDLLVNDAKHLPVELSLLKAAFYQFYYTEILPRIQNGKDNEIFIIDRWLLSTYVYQSISYGASLTDILDVMSELECLFQPDATIILDAKDDVIDKRLGNRISKDRFESNEMQLLVRQAYRYFSTEKRYTKVDISFEDTTDNFKAVLSKVLQVL